MPPFPNTILFDALPFRNLRYLPTFSNICIVCELKCGTSGVWNKQSFYEKVGYQSSVVFDSPAFFVRDYSNEICPFRSAHLVPTSGVPDLTFG